MPPPPSDRQSFRIGVDVGGTNSDAVLLDVTPSHPSPVLASAKSPTTPDVTLGIQSAIKLALEKAGSSVDLTGAEAVNIGTTHFVNALIERNVERLDRVAVIRLCGPFSRLTPPFSGFPYELRDLMEGPHFFVEGGLQIDGTEISVVDEAEIVQVCETIRTQGIRAVVVSAVYSPIDFTVQQEELVASIVARELPGAMCTMSKTVANLGLLERENASILNASLLHFAHKTVESFKQATKALSLTCPVFITSNDGTLLSCEQAAKLPIRTFSSGPTNSMRGAAFLANLASGGQGRKRETALVVDVGGTTTDVGVLLPTGFPRQAASTHDFCGVRLNFSMPHVHSIGLGGGSRVVHDAEKDKTSVGPSSVGYRILEEAKIFGGSTLTATDIVVASGRAPSVGNALLVNDVNPKIVKQAEAKIKVMVETVLDAMKTSAQDVPVYLVGGGSIVAPDVLNGVSHVHRFPFFDCANAVGAAVAQVAGVVDSVENISEKTIPEVRLEVEQRARKRAIEAGADPETVAIIESEQIPIAYTAGRCRFYVKAAGEWSGKTASLGGSEPAADPATVSVLKQVAQAVKSVLSPTPKHNAGAVKRVDLHWNAAVIEGYRPKVVGGEWFLSEIDLQWIADGAYILGTGGGGSPQHDFLSLREKVRAGKTIRVVDLKSLDKDALIGWGGGLGSPEVSSERLMGEEYNEALAELLNFMGVEIQALAALEIGGSNGMISMIAGASDHLDKPVCDGDFMGRAVGPFDLAFPTAWQVTPNVFDTSGKGESLLPVAIASGDGTSMFMTTSKTDRTIDDALRAACTTMGTLVGAALRPLTVADAEQSLIKNTVSLAWRIGKAVMLANKSSQISRIGQIVIDAIGGPSTGKILFAGKILEVTRTVYKGHTIGEVTIAAIEGDEDEDDDPEHPKEKFEGLLKIPFKNENLICRHESPSGETTIVATVPDLICVLDAQNGQALGTPDYKYGSRVIVLGVTAAPQWTKTARGLELGAAGAFGYDIPYSPLGEYVQPKSVIEEYS